MSHVRYFIALEENIDKAHDGILLRSRKTADRLCGKLIGNTGKPWKVFECIVHLPSEGQYAGDRRELRKALNGAHTSSYRLCDAILLIRTIATRDTVGDGMISDELADAIDSATSMTLKHALEKETR